MKQRYHVSEVHVMKQRYHVSEVHVLPIVIVFLFLYIPQKFGLCPIFIFLFMRIQFGDFGCLWVPFFGCCQDFEVWFRLHFEVWARFQSYQMYDPMRAVTWALFASKKLSIQWLSNTWMDLSKHFIETWRIITPFTFIMFLQTTPWLPEATMRSIHAYSSLIFPIALWQIMEVTIHYIKDAEKNHLKKNSLKTRSELVWF